MVTNRATGQRQDRRIIVYLVAVIICVVLGPFGTATQLPFWDRLVFWTVSISAVGFFMEVCMSSALRTPLLGSLHNLVKLIIGAVIGGLPGTAIIIFVNLVFRPEHLETSIFPALWLKVSFMALIIAALDFAVMSKDLRGLLVRNAQPRMPDAAPAEPLNPPPQAVTVPSLVNRLEPALRLSDVISLSMQDHYVEVTTTAGTDMLLMRLVDAIDLMDGQPGARLHRSHWAAEAHAVTLKREGRRHFLVLSDTRALPVSKSYLPDVEGMLTKKGQT